jgi:hypothetical protein
MRKEKQKEKKRRKEKREKQDGELKKPQDLPQSTKWA